MAPEATLEMRAEMKTDAAPKSPFNSLMQSTIQDILIDIFGEKSTKVILGTMESSHSLRMEDLPDRAQDFRDILEKILGSGHLIIEDLIVETLSTELGKPLAQNGQGSFAESIMYLRNGL